MELLLDFVAGWARGEIGRSSEILLEQERAWDCLERRTMIHRLDWWAWQQVQQQQREKFRELWVQNEAELDETLAVVET